MTDGLIIDLITVSAYDVAGEQVMVPQRVDPGRDVAQPSTSSGTASAATTTYDQPDGGAAFERAAAELPADQQAALVPIIAWPKTLEQERLAMAHRP